MPIKSYPFIGFFPDAPLRPMVTIRITNPDTGFSVNTYGLIDTGADDCAVPASFARALGHDLMAGESKRIQTGNGVTAAYSHTCTIDIFDTRQLEDNTLKIAYTMSETLIDFMPNLHCVLLGTESFLNQFVLSVDYPAKMFSIRKP